MQTKPVSIFIILLIIAALKSGPLITPARGGVDMVVPQKSKLFFQAGNLTACQIQAQLLGNNQLIAQKPLNSGGLWIPSNPQDFLAIVEAQTKLEFRFTTNASCAGTENRTFSSKDPTAFVRPTPNGWQMLWEGIGPGSFGRLTLILVAIRLEPTAPQHHPVVFIHGLGGKPQDWISGNKSMYWQRLDQEGWPPNYRASYAYADYNHDGKYDYQGDIREIENDLPTLINQLAALYQADGGNCDHGCVDLVGFSLGGIVARQYLNEHPLDHKIRKLITIASPHEGVDWLSLKDWLQSMGSLGNAISSAFYSYISQGINLIHGPNGQPLDFNSEAANQLSPEGSYLSQLNTTATNNLQESSLLYGNIDVRLQQKFFFFNLVKTEISLGDILISTKSATGMPSIGNSNIYEFSDPKVTEINVKLMGDINAYHFELDTIRPEDHRFWHLALPKQPEVVDTVFEILNSG